jgi:hypothetical protein
MLAHMLRDERRIWSVNEYVLLAESPSSAEKSA